MGKTLGHSWRNTVICLGEVIYENYGFGSGLTAMNHGTIMGNAQIFMMKPLQMMDGYGWITGHRNQHQATIWENYANTIGIP